MNHDKLNVLSSGGMKDLNYNSESHEKFHYSQNALMPQSKNNIARTKKKEAAFHPVMPELIESILLYSEYL